MRRKLGILKVDLYRSLVNWKLLVAIVAFALTYLVNSDWQLLCGYGKEYIIPQALGSVESFSMGGRFVLMFVVFPYSCAMIEDITSQEWMPLMLRSGRENYIFSKICSCALSGGIVASAGLGMYLLVLGLGCRMSWMYPTRTANYDDFTSILICNGNTVLFYVVKLLLYFGMGMVISMMGMLLSLFFANVFVIVASPYLIISVIYMLPLQVEFSHQIENVWYGIYASSGLISGIAYGIGYFGSIFLVEVVLFSVGVRRKLG